MAEGPPVELTPEQAEQVKALLARVDLFLHGDRHLKLAGDAGWELDRVFQKLHETRSPNSKRQEARELLLKEVFDLRHELLMAEGFEVRSSP